MYDQRECKKKPNEKSYGWAHKLGVSTCRDCREQAGDKVCLRIEESNVIIIMFVVCKNGY